MASQREWDDRFRQGDHADSVPDPFFTTSRRYWPMIPGWTAQAEKAGTSTGANPAVQGDSSKLSCFPIGLRFACPI